MGDAKDLHEQNVNRWIAENPSLEAILKALFAEHPGMQVVQLAAVPDAPESGIDPRTLLIRTAEGEDARWALTPDGELLDLAT